MKRRDKKENKNKFTCYNGVIVTSETYSERLTWWSRLQWCWCCLLSFWCSQCHWSSEQYCLWFHRLRVLIVSLTSCKTEWEVVEGFTAGGASTQWETQACERRWRRLRRELKSRRTKSVIGLTRRFVYNAHLKSMRKKHEELWRAILLFMKLKDTKGKKEISLQFSHTCAEHHFKDWENPPQRVCTLIFMPCSLTR